jgi:hypothetical protein
LHRRENVEMDVNLCFFSSLCCCFVCVSVRSFSHFLLL